LFLMQKSFQHLLGCHFLVLHTNLRVTQILVRKTVKAIMKIAFTKYLMSGFISCRHLE